MRFNRATYGRPSHRRSRKDETRPALRPASFVVLGTPSKIKRVKQLFKRSRYSASGVLRSLSRSLVSSMPFLSTFSKLQTKQDILSYLTLFPAVLFVGKELRGCDSLIDVGCGEASWIRFVHFNGTKLGIDGWGRAIERSSEKHIHDSYMLSDIRALSLPPTSSDAVLCLDVIEHFSKVESTAVVNTLIGLARRVVIIVTPNGFVEQVPADGNEYQRHRCGWTVSELRNAGFEVHGILGIKALRGPFGHIARQPVPVWWLISKLSEWYVWLRPERAFSLLAIKKK